MCLGQTVNSNGENKEKKMANHGVTEEECRFLEIKKMGKLTIYNMYFESISAVELFLKDDPPVNKDIFISQDSKTAPERFAGPPLETAIRYCVGGYEENYSQFLDMAQQLQNLNTKLCEERDIEPAFVGHRPNVPAYIADAPKCMYRRKRYVEKKVVNVFMQATYSSSTSERQILHRGILALNLIRLLEMNGYIVQFRLFEASCFYNEAFVCEVVLKRQGEKIDPRKCFYPMCGKGFVRRVLLRIKESIPFNENWHMGYGNVLDEKSARRLLNADPDDIYIDTPDECGIEGRNMYADANRFLKKLGLDGKIKAPYYDENEEESASQSYLDTYYSKKGNPGSKLRNFLNEMTDDEK